MRCEVSRHHQIAALSFFFLFLLVSPVCAGMGQDVQNVPPARRGPLPAGNHEEPDPRSAFDPMKLQHMREEERHKRLLADTARLVALTNDLKVEVEKASKDELSLDVVRKAAEIEKLAHDVKERMKS